MSATRIDATTPIPLTAVLHWLEQPEGDAGVELAAIPTLLPTLLTSAELTPAQRREILELIQLRSQRCLDRLFPELENAPLPAPPALRQRVAQAQQALAALAAALSEAIHSGDRASALDAAARCLQLHLELGAYVAAPPTPGIWLRLHELQRQARLAGLRLRPYYAAQLLACTQPASLSPPELSLLRTIIATLNSLPDTPDHADPAYTGLYWIGADRDEGATALARRPPPPETPVQWFACDRQAVSLTAIADALANGKSPAIFQLPDFAATPAGLATLRRAVRCWDTPPKRRFQRRRQNLRATLVIGLDAVRHTLRHGQPPADAGLWMITNDSPDGCGAMHISGPTGTPATGEPVALRPHGGDNAWQLCVVRWTLSENSAHLELGLQRLAIGAHPAEIVTPSQRTPAVAFTLPPHHTPALLTVAGALPEEGMDDAVLLQQHGEQLIVGDITLAPCLEQTARSDWRAWRPQHR
jgi:hypothetical protein